MSPEPTPSETAALTRAVGAGDRDALGVLYERWFDRTYAHVRRVTGRDEAFCLDVCQDTFLKLVRSIGVCPSDEALGAWLRVAATRTALDALRAESRRRARERRVARPERAPAREAPNAETLRRVESELGRLERDRADLLTARTRFGWTLGAIGRAFGLSPGAADARITRAARRVRDAIGGLDD